MKRGFGMDNTKGFEEFLTEHFGGLFVLLGGFWFGEKTVNFGKNKMWLVFGFSVNI